MDSSPTISHLTDDLLLRVLSRLNDDSDRRSFRATCRTFLRVDSLLRTSISVLRLETLPGLLRKCTEVEHLDLSGCAGIDDAAIALLLGFGGEWTRRLKQLGLRRALGLRPGGLEMLVRQCPQLEVVDMSYCCGFGDREVSALFCAELRELRLDKCLGLTDVGLATVAVGCGERLEKLSLKWCLEITDLGIDLLVKKCSSLKYLDISYLKVTSESLRSISSLQKLETLYMVGCGFVDDFGLQFLGKGCPSLQVWDASRCDEVSSSGLISVIQGINGLRQISMGYCFFELSTTFLHSLKGLKNLNRLRIDGARVSGSSFHAIAAAGKFLVEIGLSKCEGVTDASLIYLACSCRNMEIIDLTCCGSITDLAVMALAYYCRNLLCLKLESCGFLTENSLQLLGSHCSLLREVDLTDCSGITDTGLEHLSRCSQLLSLRLGLCTGISDKGLFYIASKCSKLLEVDLYRCAGIGDHGLAALSYCKKLKKLNLGYCNKLTDRGMQNLSILEELYDLEMRGLPNITSVGLRALSGGCRRLSKLDLKHCGNIDDPGFLALAFYLKNLCQINISFSRISDVGLCMLMGNLTRLQDAKLVNLPNVSVQGFELALRASFMRLKKVKLLGHFRPLLSPDLLEGLSSRGCIIRWD